jgi:Recombination endonuclease VII
VKTCRACGKTKSLDEFHKASKTPDGRQYRCKECSISAARQRAIDNPEAAREADRRYRQTDKYKATRKRRRDGPQRERILEQKRASWYRNHDSNLEKLREREGDPEFRRKQRERYAKWRANDPRGAQRIAIKNLYGLTLEQWDRMVVQQRGCCAICGEQSRDLHVDHCHETGTIRALLCQKCNRGLGLFDDDPDRLRTAARYVVKHRRAAA